MSCWLRWGAWVEHAEWVAEIAQAIAGTMKLSADSMRSVALAMMGSQ